MADDLEALRTAEREAWYAAHAAMGSAREATLALVLGLASAGRTVSREGLTSSGFAVFEVLLPDSYTHGVQSGRLVGRSRVAGSSTCGGRRIVVYVDPANTELLWPMQRLAGDRL